MLETIVWYLLCYVGCIIGTFLCVVVGRLTEKLYERFRRKI